MAKSKADYWLTEEGLTLLTGWARDGFTDEQIALKMGIHTSTFYVYKAKYKEISDALKIGKEACDYVVEEALVKNAVGYWTEEITTEKMWDEQLGKMVVVKEKTVKKFVPANPTSQIFWLKNRNPDKWKDKREETITTEDNSIMVKLEGVLADYAK